MKEKAKRLLVLVLTFSMIFSTFPSTAWAATTDTKEAENTEEGVISDDVVATIVTEAAAKSEDTAKTELQSTIEGAIYTSEDNTIDVYEYNVTVKEANAATQEVLEANGLSDTVSVTYLEDETTGNATTGIIEMDVELQTVKDELDQTGLSDEEKEDVLALYNQYMEHYRANPQYLGRQVAYQVSKEDDEDSLGPLGSMLVTAGYSVDDVRNGIYASDAQSDNSTAYTSLMMTIQTFYFANMFGIQFYGDQLLSVKDEALEAVEAADTQTEAQELLVLDDWLAHHSTFNMAYIMNMSSDGLMTAEDPRENEYYSTMVTYLAQNVYAEYDNYGEGYSTYVATQMADAIIGAWNGNHIGALCIGEGVCLAYTYAYAYLIQYLHPEVYGVDGVTTSAQLEDADNWKSNDDLLYKTTETTEQVTTSETTWDGVTYYSVTISGDDSGDNTGDDSGDNTGDDSGDNTGDGSGDNTGDGSGDNTGDGSGDNTGDDSGDNTGDGSETNTSYVENYTVSEGETTTTLDVTTDTTVTNYPLYVWSEEKSDYVAATDDTGAYLYVQDYDESLTTTENTGYPVYVTATTTENVTTTTKTLDTDAGYIVDYVRINYQANVSMYGEASDFSSEHYWNAVKLDGTWYYIDSCYTDIYVECMVRERVETNGNMNHVYFLMSDTAARSMYDGYYDSIDTLYEDLATDRRYENNTWMYYAASNVYSDEENYYYLYDSTDMIGLVEEYGGMFGSGSSSSWDTSSGSISYDDEDAEYKLVSYEKSGTDIVDEGEDKYTTVYVDFNNGQVLNPKTGELEDNELIQELYAQFEEESEKYPSVELSAALYDNKLYFNLSNCVLSYDLDSGEVVKVKEYNTVGAVRDTTIDFGGMAFTVTNDLDEADLTVTNAPIASLTIKEDGNLYVDIATNYAFISGKDSVDDSTSYGYEFQESNYNSDYSSYMSMMMNNMTEDDEYYDMMKSYMSDETNDNDEFMWSANFTDIIEMSELTADESSHKFEEVSVDAYCGRDAFTEERCADCGLIKDGTRVEEEGTACDHHYVHFDETYYTKDDSDNWNTGECYVCTMCGYAVESDYTSDSDDYVDGTDTWDDAAAKAGHTYVPASDATVTWADDYSSVKVEGDIVCSVCENITNKYGYALDCLQDDDTLKIEDQTLEATDVEVSYSGTCTEGVTTTYTATATLEDYGDVTITEILEGEAGEHAYVVEDGDWVWTWNDETETYDVVATTMTCAIDGDVQENVTAEVTSEIIVEPTCTTEGTIVYTAVATVYDTDEEGNKVSIGSATDTKEETLEALGHDWDEIVWSDWAEAEDGSYTITASRTCKTCEELEQAEVVVTPTTEDATCTVAGTVTYTATATFSDGTTANADPKVVEGVALGHNYEATSWVWGTDYSSATVTLTCSRCGDVQTVDAVVTENEDARVEETCTTDGSYTYVATATYEGVTYTDTKVKTVDALGHTLGEEVTWSDWTEQEDGSYTITATRICTECGAAEEVEGIVTASSEDATCTVAGTVTYNATATFSDGVTAEAEPKVVEGVVLGHDYETTNWTWTNDYSGATLTLTCSRCGDVQTATATVAEDTSLRSVETCTAEGSYTYVATATFDGVTYKDTKIKTVAALGHNYVNGVCTNCGGKKSGYVNETVGATVNNSTGTYTVTSTGTSKTVSYTKASSTATSVAIPSTITINDNTYKVTEISASAFKGNTKIKTVSVPSTVTTIGKSAFEGCTALTAVSGCASVTTISNRAFYGCKKLTQVGSAKGKVKLTQVKTIGSYAFYGCKSITVVNITSKNLTKINNYAFQNCTKLKKFVAKSTKLAKIGKKAFYGDKKLANVTLKTTKLKGSKVGAKAFTGIKKTCTFKVPSKKVSAYRKLFVKKGANAKIKVKK